MEKKVDLTLRSDFSGPKGIEKKVTLKETENYLPIPEKILRGIGVEVFNPDLEFPFKGRCYCCGKTLVPWWNHRGLCRECNIRSERETHYLPREPEMISDLRILRI